MPSDEQMELTARDMGITAAQLREIMENDGAESETWVNDLYQVRVKRFPIGVGEGRELEMVWLNIRRRDGRAIQRDWRHFQRIKNEIVGPECEGFELYPADSRMVDTTNKYHLYVFNDPTYRIPVGMQDRDVMDAVEGATAPGFRQRPFQ
jgi:hypothetical protein